eukprot:SAG31_NODE_849_length_11529_cov_3.342257_10_plen_67_part_00
MMMMMMMITHRRMNATPSVLSRSFAHVHVASGPRQDMKAKSDFLFSGDWCTVLLQTVNGYQSWQPT